MNAKCEECDADIPVPEDAIIGEIVKCKECGSDYEVEQISKSEVKLKAAEVAEEDWGE